MKSIAKRLASIVAVNCAVVLVLTLIFWILFPRVSLHAIFRGNIAIGLVYSNCIGTLAALFLPYLGPFFGRTRAPWNWAVILPAVLAVNAVGCALAGLIIYAFELFPRDRFWIMFDRSSRIATIITLVFGISSFAYETLKHRLNAATLALRAREAERERALKLATEARLASLESRVHPHFLFNTINSITALIRDDPGRAERMLERLAALLRFSLDSSTAGLVPLEQEMKIVQDYLEIEKARFGNRLRYSVHTAPQALRCELPPMSIQTLVENSVKYAIAPSRDGGEIRVTASTSDRGLEIVVADSGPGLSPGDVKPGHGLDNLRSRLATVFGEEAAVEISGSAVRIRVPLRQGVGRA